MSYCANCNHQFVVLPQAEQFPFLCGKCTSDPYRIHVLPVLGNFAELANQSVISDAVFRACVTEMATLKLTCDTNPAPVVIGLTFTELHADGGKVLMIQRNIEPYAGGWALVSGYIIDTLSWRDNLRKETMEEASVRLSPRDADIQPFTFANNEPKTNLLLNFAVVLPSGVVEVLPHTPDRETKDRQEFAFTRDVWPDFCMPIHRDMFRAFCHHHFGW